MAMGAALAAQSGLRIRQPRQPRQPKPRATVGAMIRVCPGGRQAWYECPTTGHPIRKPLAGRV